MPTEADTLVLVQQERRRLEQHLSQAYRFLAQSPGKSVHSWFVTAVDDTDGRRWLSDLLEFPPGMDGPLLQQLFGSDCAFSKTSLALAARRLFYLLRPFKEILRSSYAPGEWAELDRALTALLDSCRPYSLAQPLTWSMLWSMVAQQSSSEANPLRTVNLESHITFALDGREFSILEVTNSLRSDDSRDWTDWTQRSASGLTWIQDLLNRWKGSASRNDRLMLETAWWALETGVWLSTAAEEWPEGRPAIPDWAVSHLKGVVNATSTLLDRLSEVGRLDVAPPPVDAQHKIRLASTPEVFGPDRSLLFAAKNGMRLASRLRLAAWLQPEAKGAEHLADLDSVIERSCKRIVALRDNGHLWWAQQRVSTLYDWIDYHRLKSTIEALCRNADGANFTLNGIQRRGKWLLADEVAKIVDEVAGSIHAPLMSLSGGGDPKNREMSIVLLAGPGTGKSTLVMSVVDKLAESSGVRLDREYNERKLQHLPTQSAFRSWLEESTKSGAKVKAGKVDVPVIFLDELHLKPQECDQYSELLPCLEDNVVLSKQGEDGFKVEDDRVAVFIFATSKYLDQWSFVRDAQKWENQAMVDFATRIAVWQSIPPLEYLPLQRVAIYCGSAPAGTLRAADLIWIGTTTGSNVATGRGVSNAAKLAKELRNRVSDELRERFGLAATDLDGQVKAPA